MNKKESRREFLKKIGRYASLGALTTVGVSLAVKNENDCEVNSPCRNCFKLGGCSEDKAVELKEKLKKDLNQSKKETK